MSSNALTQINRLRKEIARLKVADSQQASKASTTQSHISRAEQAVQRTTNSSTIQSKRKEVPRRLKELARIQAKQGGSCQ